MLYALDSNGRVSGRVRVNARALNGIREPQGEAVTIAIDNTMYLAGEGGKEKNPGTFARMRCPVHRGR